LKAAVRILFACHEFPIASYAGTHRVLYSIKHLAEKYGHDITLVAFKLPRKNYPDLSRYGRIETVELPFWPGLKSPSAVFTALKNVFRGRFSLANQAYSSRMSQILNTLLAENRFDVIVFDHPVMLAYAPKQKIPVVLLETFELAEIAFIEYRNEKNWLVKPIRLLYYLQMKNYAERYRVAKLSIAVSSEQKGMVKSHCPELDIIVLPTGIDTDYFRTVEPESESPDIIITGSMGDPRNKEMVLYFYNEIYHLIRAKVSGLKLHIVGSSPGKEIRDLATDDTVVVTGFVEDLRPYLSRAWVVVAPLREGFGMKIKVLQAMAMGKAIVTTSPVRSGINVSPAENIIIADKPQDFADKVVELLKNKGLRDRLGSRARQLMQTEYSWEKFSERLNFVLEDSVKEYTDSGNRGI